MRLSRDQFFDLVELIGKAIATGRKKPADESWLEERMFQKPEPDQDPYGLLQGTAWASGKGENFGFAVPEKTRARRTKNAYGDAVAARLWDIDRQVRFRMLTVTDGLDRLRELCDGLKLLKFISAGWAQTLRAVMDKRCL